MIVSEPDYCDAVHKRLANFEFLEQVGAKYTWEHADDPAPEPARGGNYGLGGLDSMRPSSKVRPVRARTCPVRDYDLPSWKFLDCGTVGVACVPAS
jgi:hypothetical protein